MSVAISVHNAHQYGGKLAVMLLTSIALTLVVSFSPIKVLLPAKIILVFTTIITTSFVAVLVPFRQPTGGLVDICEARQLT
jgi:hypothetical protein